MDRLDPQALLSLKSRLVLAVCANAALLICAWLLIAAPGFAAFTGERWAVVIGVSDYEDERLKLNYAHRDAKAFRDFLKSDRGGGFSDDHIRFLQNKAVTDDNIREALGSFLARAAPEDYVVIFLAGHGQPDPQDASDFYFLPHNAKLDRLPSTAVSMWELQRWVSKIKAERIVLIADACHSGAIGSSGRARGPNEINRYLQKLGESFESVLTITSSSDYQLSQEDKKWGGGHGVFTYYLLQALQQEAEKTDENNDGIIEPKEAFRYVLENVTKDTNYKQIPDRTGDFGSGVPLAVISSQSPPPETKSKAEKPPTPTRVASPAEEATARRIEALLRECDAHFRANRLTTGRGGNAVDCYTEVLRLERGNAEALAGLEQVVDRYASWADAAIRRGDPSKAATYLHRAEQISPESPVLAAIRAKMTGVAGAVSPKPAPQPPNTFRDHLRDRSQGPEMVVIPAGVFRMGDIQGGGYDHEKPVHEVRISKRFAIGKYEVTFADYDKFAKATGQKLPEDGGWGRDKRPVIDVSWEDAEKYTEWLSKQTGKRYRLPTEAEWEYAARAGTETPYWWGNDIGHNRANCKGCGSQWGTH